MTTHFRRRLLAGAALFPLGLALLCASGCETLGIGVEYIAWFPKLKMGASKDPATIDVDQIELNTDIEATNVVTNYSTRVTIFGSTMFIESFHTNVASERNVENGFTINSVDFLGADPSIVDSGDRATSVLDFTLSRFNYEMGVSVGDLLNLAFILGIDALDIDLSVTNETTLATAAHWDGSVPAGTADIGTLVEHIPLMTVGARMEVNLGLVGIYARIQGMETEWVAGIAEWLTDIQDMEGFSFDGEAGVRWWPGNGGQISLSLGYRFYNMDLTFNATGDEVDILMDGVQFTIAARLP